ncbi:MAG: nitrilase-related carbon-nitrogen hydrolase [Thermoanaerobaculum sp.]
MRAYLSRFVCGLVEENLERLHFEVSLAAAVQADLVVFPELFLTGYRQNLPTSRAREVFSGLSSAHPQSVFVFGAVVDEGYNRLTVWQAGKEIAHYHKVHLFRPNREHELWKEGDRYVAVKLPWANLGLLTCNDVRFPEQARALVLHGGATVLVAVAWWPWRRDHIWRTLLQARAIENASWVLGCCIAACTNPEEPFAGAGNYAFDPLGNPIPTDNDVVFELDLHNPLRILVDPRECARDIDTVEVARSRDSG